MQDGPYSVDETWIGEVFRGFRVGCELGKHAGIGEDLAQTAPSFCLVILCAERGLETRTCTAKRRICAHTSAIVNLLEAPAQSRAVFELEALFIRGNGIVPAMSSVEGGTLACITLGPLRVYPDALADETIGKGWSTGRSRRRTSSASCNASSHSFFPAWAALLLE